MKKTLELANNKGIEQYIKIAICEYGPEVHKFLTGKNFDGLNSRYCYDKGVEIGLGAEKAQSGLEKVQKIVSGKVLEKTNEIIEKLVKTGLISELGKSVKSTINDSLGYKKLDIVDSVKDIMKKALENAPDELDLQASDSEKTKIKTIGADTIIFGDMHGQLDLFLQNLYIAGIIDKNGNVKEQEKPLTVVLNGDTVDNGAYEVEGMVMLRAIVKMAKEKNIKFQCLVGNHDSVQLIFAKQATQEREMMKEIMITDILRDDVKVAYADDKSNFLCFHGGMQKKVLIETLMNMSCDPEFKHKMQNNKDELNLLLSNLYLKRNLNREDNPEYYDKIKDKVSTSRIYKDFVYGNNIKLSDIASYINRSFVSSVYEIHNMDNRVEMQQYYTKFAYLFLKHDSVLHTRKKAGKVNNPRRGLANINEYLIPSNVEKYDYKPTQFVGHNCTGCPKRYGYGIYGGIMQNRATVYTDVGLAEFFGGKQAFVALDKTNSKAYAIEIAKDDKSIAGLDDTQLPIPLEQKKDNIRIREINGIKLNSMSRKAGPNLPTI